MALMILDALKQIRHISDSSPNHVLNQLFFTIQTERDDRASWLSFEGWTAISSAGTGVAWCDI
jgi:hypothetical protein